MSLRTRTDRLLEEVGVERTATLNSDVRALAEAVGIGFSSLPAPLTALAPVLAADGFTYDRHAISAWLARGKTTSPTTGAPLAHTHLTPNHLVKSMIAEYQSSLKGGAAAGGGN